MSGKPYSRIRESKNAESLQKNMSFLHSSLPIEMADAFLSRQGSGLIFDSQNVVHIVHALFVGVAGR